MSYGSYTSLDTLAANGIIDFDANAYITGAPPRYAGKLYSNNYLPYQQPMMDMYTPYAMYPAMGYMGGTPGPMNGYQGPWTSVQPEHANQHFAHPAHYAHAPQMHAQPIHDEFAVEKSHNASSTGKWIAGITAGILGLWGLVKYIDMKHIKKIKKEKKVAQKAAKKASQNLENLKDLKGFDKVKGWFRNTGKRLEHAPKWVKISLVALLGAAGIFGLISNIAKNRYAKVNYQQQYPQQPQQPQ